MAIRGGSDLMAMYSCVFLFNLYYMCVYANVYVVVCVYVNAQQLSVCLGILD